MRTYGRIVDKTTGKKVWVEIQTDSNGFNDQVYITTLAQVLLLNLGESPFYANYGLPAKNADVTQIAPDLYVTITQQQFSQYFASLIITKVAAIPPTYNVFIVTNSGAKIQFKVQNQIPY